MIWWYGDCSSRNGNYHSTAARREEADKQLFCIYSTPTTIEFRQWFKDADCGKIRINIHWAHGRWPWGCLMKDPGSSACIRDKLLPHCKKFRISMCSATRETGKRLRHRHTMGWQLRQSLRRETELNLTNRQVTAARIFCVDWVICIGTTVVGATSSDGFLAVHISVWSMWGQLMPKTWQISRHCREDFDTYGTHQDSWLAWMGGIGLGWTAALIYTYCGGRVQLIVRTGP